MKNILIGILIFLSICLLFCLIRAIKGPRPTDRLVSINMMGSITMVIIAILAIYLDEGYLVDICLIYAAMSFLAVVIYSKVYIGVHKEHMKTKEMTENKEKNDNKATK